MASIATNPPRYRCAQAGTSNEWRPHRQARAASLLRRGAATRSIKWGCWERSAAASTPRQCRRTGATPGENTTSVLWPSLGKFLWRTVGLLRVCGLFSRVTHPKHQPCPNTPTHYALALPNAITITHWVGLGRWSQKVAVVSGVCLTRSDSRTYTFRGHNARDPRLIDAAVADDWCLRAEAGGEGHAVEAETEQRSCRRVRQGIRGY